MIQKSQDWTRWAPRALVVVAGVLAGSSAWAAVQITPQVSHQQEASPDTAA